MQLDIKGGDGWSIEDGLGGYFTSTETDRQCEHCNEMTGTTINQRIIRFPNAIVILVKRFTVTEKQFRQTRNPFIFKKVKVCSFKELFYVVVMYVANINYSLVKCKRKRISIC